MRSLSITAKVFGALALCLFGAAAVLVSLAQRTYRTNVKLVAERSLTVAERAFENARKAEASKLGATVTALMADDKMRELFVKRDRKALYEHAQPLYRELNDKFAVTNWLFIDSEPAMFVFLRMHDPSNHSEVFWHRTALSAIESQSLVTGMELGKFGFALRAVAPYRDRTGKTVGYLEVGEDIARFAATMKGQTGDDYALVASKALLDPKAYATSIARRRERSAWDDSKDSVVLGSTSGKAALVRFDGDVAGLPPSGRFIDEQHDGGRVAVRGAFPLVDAQGNAIGAVFVQRDITTLHEQMVATRNGALVTVAALLMALWASIGFMLRTLVFSRIERTMLVATRVVGGDFDTPIVTNANDEVGRLEMMLENFRRVFVNTVYEYSAQLQSLSRSELANSDTVLKVGVGDVRARSAR